MDTLSEIYDFDLIWWINVTLSMDLEYSKRVALELWMKYNWPAGLISKQIHKTTMQCTYKLKTIDFANTLFYYPPLERYCRILHKIMFSKKSITLSMDVEFKFKMSNVKTMNEIQLTRWTNLQTKTYHKTILQLQHYLIKKIIMAS